ncbi:hypothetical protein JQC92_18600 [Shewanella sp. 202IG2-18]|uniref:hypothetical protein n=1 Tax=Parashewanella hymeniacidonis TaxID=2807618 RepID=UPI0019600FAD|nr:hypothetical protein [Parashewanella hymeniacidonis]MBM7074019.1 hypothetical protein [Parashewanella hymeniacidonis]
MKTINLRKIGLILTTILVTFTIAVGLSVFWNKYQTTPSTPFYARALTTDAGNELFPDFSSDGTRVSYMSAQSDRMHLMIKNVVDDRITEITHKDNMGVGPADWSDDGQLLAYLVATPQHCQYYIRSISGLELGEPRLIHNCPAGSYGKIVFTHDNNRLVFSENEGRNTPYSLFEFNLTTNKNKRLHQPEIYLGGNSQFDLHPTQDKLLISSPDKQQWEGFYSLDLKTEQLKLLFKQDAYICCGIWDHDGTRVVLMGEHPAYQLLSYNLAGKDRQVIYSGSRQIKHPRRHTNGVDYLFSAGDNNVNIHAINTSTNQQWVVANNSLDERLARFAHHDNQIAYVALASGSEELWLTNTENNHRQKLTHFNDDRHYVDLMWSPKGDYLVALTLNEIHLVYLSTGQFKRLNIPQTEIVGVSFKSESNIAYSIKHNHQYRAYSYSLKTDEISPEDSQWQLIQYHADPKNTLWLDKNNQLFEGELPTLVENPVIPTNKLIDGRQFNLRKRDQLWVWFEQDEKSKIQGYSEQSKKLVTLTHTNVNSFDIKGNILLFGRTKQINTNVYQTQSLNSK